MRLATVVRFLNSELKIRSVKDVSRNGLQRHGTDKVRKVGFAVDACMDTFKEAVKRRCQLLVVHHGILWKGQKDETGQLKRRLAFLKRHKLSLYACHLPLDMHPVLGNNIGLCRLLGIRNHKPFGSYHGSTIGYKGKLSAAISTHALMRLIDRALHTRSKCLAFGTRKIRTVGVVSGGGAFSLPEAIKDKLDAVLVGDASHEAFHVAKEGKINLIIAGHYATETVGVKALQRLLEERFRCATAFIDVPTGM